MKLLWMEIENFKGISRFRLDLGGKSATVYGANATGKTTLADAFTWLVLGKDAAGRADFAVKPLGPDGQPLARGVETSVRASLELEDGATTTLRRTYSEKWERRRGSAQAEMTGHTTAFEVDGLPVKMADYKAYVERLCPEKTFQALTSPEFFCAVLPWQERRRVLAQMAGAVSEEEIFAQNPELLPLRDALQGRRVEDFKRIQERQRAALSKELDGLPARIDEASRAVRTLEGDPAQARAEEARLRGERQALSDALARGRDGALEAVERALAEKRAEVAERIAENARRRAEIAEDLRRAAREMAKPLQAKLNEARAEVARLRVEGSLAAREAETLGEAVQALRERYARTAKETWRGDLACPTCKRPYAAEDIAAARETFAAVQQAQLRELADEGRKKAQAQAEAAQRAEDARKSAESQERPARAWKRGLRPWRPRPRPPTAWTTPRGLRPCRTSSARWRPARRRSGGTAPRPRARRGPGSRRWMRGFGPARRCLRRRRRTSGRGRACRSCWTGKRKSPQNWRPRRAASPCARRMSARWRRSPRRAWTDSSGASAGSSSRSRSTAAWPKPARPRWTACPLRTSTAPCAPTRGWTPSPRSRASLERPRRCSWTTPRV